MNIHEFLNTLIRFSYANLNSVHVHLVGNAHETRVAGQIRERQCICDISY